MEEPLLALEGVTKSFDSTPILKGVSLSVGRAEFLTFLGPSGCGKTTTLRLIAGFEQPDSGRVLLAGEDVTALPPYRRDVHTVFQHYALFPHYDVFDNVAFGLRLKKLPEAQIKERVASALALVKLSGFERRRTTSLSGGQMQRIAMARALVGRPRLLLLDEPLGALDLKLRREMQLELKAIQKSLGIAFIYVTHDQEEAMTMSDRIAVFNQGRIEQLGAPAEIYERPRTRFVADFIGSANVFSARLLDSSGGGLKLRLEDELDVELSGASTSASVGDVLEVAIRPERVKLHYEAPPALANGTVRLSARLKDSVYLGNSSQIYLSPFSQSAKTLLCVSLGAHSQDSRPPAGSSVWADIKPRDILLLEPKSDA